MKTTIVFAHPWHGSYNKAIMDTIVRELQKRKKGYQIIDLNKDDFDPVLRESDLSLYSRGESKDEMVKNYQLMLMNSDEIVFIFPIWWFDAPAILKGFFDKVMLKNYAYTEGKGGLKGKLTNIRSTTVITTSESPTWYLKYIVGNQIKGTFIKGTLNGIGLKKVKWLNSDYVTSGTNERRKKFLLKIVKEFSI